MAKIILSWFFILASFLSVFGESSPFGLSLSDEQRETLLSGGVIMGRMDNSPFPVNMPFHSLTEELTGRFPIDVYGDILVLRKRTDALGDDEFLLAALNTFLSTSDQKGIRYKSDSRGWITLISDSYALDGELRRTENHSFSRLPTEAELYAYQKDYYFSGNKFQYRIETAPGGIRIGTTNLTTMRVKGVFKAVDKEGMDMEFYFLTDGEYLCAYGIALIGDIKNPVEAFGLSVDLPSAMSKRMAAVMDWFFSAFRVP